MVGAVRPKTGWIKERGKRGEEKKKSREWRGEMQGGVQERKEGEVIQREKSRDNRRRRAKECRKEGRKEERRLQH